MMSPTWRHAVAAISLLVAVLLLVRRRRFVAMTAQFVNLTPRFGERPDFRSVKLITWGVPIFFVCLAAFLVFA